MSKPKYYYELSIYGPEKSETTSKVVPVKPQGWYAPLGLGSHLITLFSSSKASAKKLATSGSELLDYAASLEGTLKLGFITSCTCVGGIVTLALRPRGRIRKLFYPSLFLATSSAICYPSTAYMVAKTAAVYSYDGGEKAYSGIKVVTQKISEWRSVKKTTVHEQGQDVGKSDNVIAPEEPSADSAPVRNAPNFDPPKPDVDVKTEDVQTPALPPESETIMNNQTENEDYTLPSMSSMLKPMKPDASADEVPPNDDSIVDMGQSSKEDNDLYTTRM